MGLTAERARHLISYDPSTGSLIWRQSKGAAGAGSPAGGTHRNKGYGEVMVDGVTVSTHRLAWFIHYGEWPKGHLDHINGCPADNRIANLRDVEGFVNHQNVRRSYKSKRKGLLGAHYNKQSKCWTAAICVNRRQIHLGRFATAEEAHEAYVAAKRKMHIGCTI